MKRYLASTTCALAMALGMIAVTPAYAAGPPSSQLGLLCGLAADILDRVEGVLPDSVYDRALSYYETYCD